MKMYVRLLGEGVEVYRPVPATVISEGICVLGGENIYNREDETWEFPPGSRVRFEQRRIGDELLPVAVERAG